MKEYNVNSNFYLQIMGYLKVDFGKCLCIHLLVLFIFMNFSRTCYLIFVCFFIQIVWKETSMILKHFNICSLKMTIILKKTSSYLDLQL